jgi:hypothetical protein
MGVKGWNVAVLVAIGAIWFCGTTQREKPVVGDSTHSGRVGMLEGKVASLPHDAAALRDLAQAYLDIHQPGMAVGAIDRAVAETRQDPNVEHLYARALLEQGRSADALVAENHVLATCAQPDGPVCSTWLIASATRRAEIIEQLVELGVEDANAQPEASSLAYHNATRQVSLAVTTQ